MPKCTYKGNRIRDIEMKWIEEKYKNEPVLLKRKKEVLRIILDKVGNKADCDRDAVANSEFCMFHDEHYWRDHEEDWEGHEAEVRKEFLKLLQSNENKKYFIGFRLPAIDFPDKVIGDLHMELTKIHGDLNANTSFQGSTWFDGAVFQGGASFEGTTFQREASFMGTTFKGGAVFRETTFKGEASFMGTTFKGVFFKLTTFEGRALFERTTVEEEASFWGIKFRKGASFYNTIFQNFVSFIGTTFGERSSFEGTTFEGEASFGDTMFEGSVYLFNLKFSENNLLVFESVLFKNPHLVYLDIDISRFIFVSTDIEKISLSNVKLPKKYLKAHELLENGKLTFMNRITIGDIIETYARLRGNLEKNLRFPDAGVLFIGEMELRRKKRYYEMLVEDMKKKEEDKNTEQILSKEIKRRIKMLLFRLYVDLVSPFALYKYFSNYGESVLRPIICSVITILGMSILFIIFKGEDLSSYLKNLELSFLLFFQIAQVGNEPSRITLLSGLERLLGFLFLVLEGLALRRLLERHR